MGRKIQMTVNMEAEWVKLFRTIWGNMATRGICDEIGGLEYRTVLAQWIDSGYPGYEEPNSDDAIVGIRLYFLAFSFPLPTSASASPRRRASAWRSQ